MPNPIFNDIAIPCFDLTWVELPMKKGGGTSSFAFVAGGGGNKTKSGVLNKIVVYKFMGEAGVEQVSSIECKHGLCENLCTAVISDHVLICASFQEKCVLMEITLDKSNEISAKELITFGSEELSEEDMSINASCFVQSSTPKEENFIITGGENGHAHVWKISGGGDKWAVTKVREFEHHNGPIKDVRPHPSRPWICTGGEDGTCRIIDIADQSLLSTVNCTSDGVGGSGKTPQCRACAFSNDGESLLTVQSGRMGDAHIVMWDVTVQDPSDDSEHPPKKSKKGAKSAAPSITLSPNKVVLASKFPITRLSMNTEDKCLAVGDCNGAITIFNTETLNKTNHYQCHDFPVTGLGFAPRSIMTNSDYAKNSKALDVLFSCSADNKLSTILVQDSTMMRNLLVFLFLLLLGVYFIRS